MSEIDKKIDIALKIKRLAEEGFEGEAQAAKLALERYMKKHNISESDLQQEVVQKFSYNVAMKDFNLFSQIVSNVCYPKPSITYRGNKKTILYIKVKPEDGILIEAKFEFYKKALEAQYKLFYSAFIQKNHLYSAKPYEESDEPQTDEERLKRFKIAMIAEGLEKEKFNNTKRIGNE